MTLEEAKKIIVKYRNASLSTFVTGEKEITEAAQFLINELGFQKFLELVNGVHEVRVESDEKI